MPVQIGAPAPSFTDPTGLLSDCHRRIEMFLKVLQEVAKIADRPLADEATQSLNTALRYFREAAPKHTADEEESLFPRLRLMEDPHVALVRSRLESLEEDHRRATPLHARVEVLGQQWLKTGSLTPEEAEEFRALVAELAVTYGEHIHVEDNVVFPIAAKLLSWEEKIAIGREMAGRRNVGPPVQLQRSAQ
jgi:hemerythrin-like domain-containing protein